MSQQHEEQIETKEDKAERARIKWTLIGLGCFLAWAMFMALWNWYDPPTPEQVEASRTELMKQVKARQARDAARAVRKEAENNRRNEVCKQVHLCGRYKSTRWGCATACEFNTCVKVRMGEDYGSVSRYCTDDGEPLETETPSGVECYLRSLGIELTIRKPGDPCTRPNIFNFIFC